MPTPPVSPAVLLDTLVGMIADEVVRRLEERGLTPAARAAQAYYSAEDNPLGSSRAFLDAARRGDFQTFRAGRRVLARREDVDAWIASRPARRRQPRAPVAEPAPAMDLKEPPASGERVGAQPPTDEELLARSGVRLTRPARGRR